MVPPPPPEKVVPAGYAQILAAKEAKEAKDTLRRYVVTHEDKARGKRTMRSRKSRRDHERSMDEEAARHSAAAASPR